MVNEVPAEAGTDAAHESAVNRLMQAAALDNPATLKKAVQDETHDKLSAAKVMTSFAERIKSERPESIDTVKDIVREMMTDTALTNLETREELVVSLQSIVTMLEEPVAVPVKPENPVLVMLSENAKRIPYAGGFIGSLIPTRLPSFARIWYNIQASPALMGALIPDGTTKTLLTLMGGEAPMKLAEMDAREHIKDHYPDGTVNMRNFTQDAFRAFNARTQDGKSMNELIDLYVGHKRDERALGGAKQTPEITFGLGDILKPEDNRKQIDAKRGAVGDNLLKEKIKKEYPEATSLDFAETTTGRTGKDVLISKLDLKPDGSPKPGSAAETILKSLSLLPSADTVEIRKSGAPALEWSSAGRIAKIPATVTPETMSLLNEIIAKEKNPAVDQLTLESRPQIRNGINLAYEGGTIGWVLHVPEDRAILAGLPLFLATDLKATDDAATTRKWLYTGGNFSPAENAVTIRNTSTQIS